MDFYVVHIPKTNQQPVPDLSGLSPMVFETCLRQLVFASSDSLFQTPGWAKFSSQRKDVEIYSGEKAFQFALEVICGLHSLIKGETEVFGQFKDFSQKMKTHIEMNSLSDVFRQLLTDCKTLRATRIQNWNSNTYGSVTRKLINLNDGVVLLGAGQLAQEIAPWLKHVPTKTVLIRKTRILESVFDQFRVELVDLDLPSLETTVLIVAADIKNQDLEKVATKWPNLRLVIDWRGDESWVSKRNETVFRLNDLKENNEKSKSEQMERIQIVNADIQNKAFEFSKRAKHNPWGWEDFSA